MEIIKIKPKAKTRNLKVLNTAVPLQMGGPVLLDSESDFISEDCDCIYDNLKSKNTVSVDSFMIIEGERIKNSR